MATVAGVSTRPLTRSTGGVGRRARTTWADNLKIALVTGVIVAHAIMAWTGVGNWVLEEPHVRDPLWSVLSLLAAVGGLFGMALFFLVAGYFTPRSFERKGLGRYLADRVVRLGVPLVAYVILLSPLVEYVDTDNAAWDRGFLAFAPTMWWPWPPAWGPTWFLAVLLVFSTVYAVWRTSFPRRNNPTVLRVRYLAGVAAAVAVASYLVRVGSPIGDEPMRIPMPQAPAWIAGFTLGAVGAERGWFEPVDPRLARRARTVALVSMLGVMGMFAAAGLLGTDLDLFLGGSTWHALVTAALEGAVVVSIPFWLVDVFQRRAPVQGRLLREAGRAAFAAFLVHQAVLVGLVLMARWVAWPPEVAWALVTVVAVVASFGLGALVVRIPGVSRVL